MAQLENPCVLPKDISAKKLYQAEMHCHTSETSPCGRVTAEYLVKAYLKENYRYLFITDHVHEYVMDNETDSEKSWDERVNSYLNGYRTAKLAAKNTDLKVLLAMEVTLKGKSPIDFLVYGVNEQFLFDNPFFYVNEYEDFYRLMHINGFMVFQAHPYRYGGSPIVPVCYDGIEIFNAHPRHISRNKKAVEYAVENNLYTISGSDVHAKEDIARGGVMLPDGIESGADFVCFIKENGSPELIITL